MYDKYMVCGNGYMFFKYVMIGDIRINRLEIMYIVYTVFKKAVKRLIKQNGRWVSKIKVVNYIKVAYLKKEMVRNINSL